MRASLTLWLTSALFNHPRDEDESIFAPLRTLLVGGDVLSPTHIRRVRDRHPELTVITRYGPTENTTFSPVGDCRRQRGCASDFGRPISNSTATVSMHEERRRRFGSG